MTHDGNVRTQVGDDITVIVNSADKRVLTLMKSARVALSSRSKRRWNSTISSLGSKDIREFQGVATRLPESRIIDNPEGYGWQLSTDGMDW